MKMGKLTGLVAKELGLVEQTLRNWVKLVEAGKLNGKGTKVVTPEQMDLSRLRAENIRLKRECEILKKATGIFPRRDVYDIRDLCKIQQIIKFVTIFDFFVSIAIVFSHFLAEITRTITFIDQYRLRRRICPMTAIVPAY